MASSNKHNNVFIIPISVTYKERKYYSLANYYKYHFVFNVTTQQPSTVSYNPTKKVQFRCTVCHSDKEKWIILLVYWADSHLQKMSLYTAWTGQSAVGQHK